MFNFIKKKEGLGSNTEEQSCCCNETVKDSCCGCDCETEVKSKETTDCCSK